MGGAILSAVVGAIFGGVAGGLAGWLVARGRPSAAERARPAAPAQPDPGVPVQTDLPLQGSDLTTAMKASQSVLDELEKRYAGTHADDDVASRSSGGARRRPAKPGRASSRAR